MKTMTVREARLSRKRPMTQDDLAAKSGVDQTYISLIERLLRVPSADIKDRLAKALGVAPSRLRFLEPQPSESITPSVDRIGHKTAAAVVSVQEAR